MALDAQAAREWLAQREAKRRALVQACELAGGEPEGWRAWPLGKALRELRRELGLKQWELAARMGARQSFVSKIERGADVHLSTLRRYLDSLGCDLVILPSPRRPLGELRRRLFLEQETARAEGRRELARLLAERRSP